MSTLIEIPLCLSFSYNMFEVVSYLRSGTFRHNKESWSIYTRKDAWSWCYSSYLCSWNGTLSQSQASPGQQGSDVQSWCEISHQSDYCFILLLMIDQNFRCSRISASACNITFWTQDHFTSSRLSLYIHVIAAFQSRWIARSLRSPSCSNPPPTAQIRFPSNLYPLYDSEVAEHASKPWSSAHDLAFARFNKTFRCILFLVSEYSSAVEISIEFSSSESESITTVRRSASVSGPSVI